jgi:hypothetical protein
VTTPSWLATLLFIVAAVLFLLAAITAAGGTVFRADAKAWFYGGLSSLAFGLAAS